MEAAHRIPVIHGVECRHLIDPHGRHLQDPRYLIHDTDAREPMLPLSKVEDRHDGGLLVLGGVPAEDLLDEFIILGSEFEGYRGIIDRRVTMLHPRSATQCAAGESKTYNKEGVAPSRCGEAECPPLSPL